jgi:hypothetical protein
MAGKVSQQKPKGTKAMINTMQKKPLSYGVLNDGGNLARLPNALMKAAEVIKAQSGKFVKADGTDDFVIAGSGDTQLIGYAVIQGVTSAGVTGYTVPTGGTLCELIVDANARFLLPADAAVTDALKGLTCDLIVASNVQQADIGESNEDVIVIYDTCAALQLVEVGLNPAKMWAAGVA